MQRRGAFLAVVFAVSALHAQTPVLPAVTEVPHSEAYVWKNVVIRAGGFITGIVYSTKKKGLVYARTDVGGAYRSDDDGGHWVPLTDQFGRDESTYLGIESIGLDPRDANKLYMAAGMYSADWGGPSAIFRSSDKGKTFERTAMPFKMGGNDNGRGCGERLAVDPNLGSILYFGSRKAGLWKSSDSGVTWSHVDSFPVKDKVAGVGENTGITFVLFDNSKGRKGKATQTIYAGVAQPGASLYRSEDAGVTWKLVDGAPAGLFPNHAALARGKALYFSFDDDIGPNDIHDGAIWKYTLDDAKWTDISPVKPGVAGMRKFGFGGLTMDAKHRDTLMVTTLDRWGPSDTFFRTTDGGATWRDVGLDAQASAPETPWAYWHHEKTGGRGWMNDIKIDPFHSERVMYTTGEGIWGSSDVKESDKKKPTHWTFPDEGIEELVPTGLISPPDGAHLLSVVSDLDGFRHEDLGRSPKDGFFIDPFVVSGTGIDFAAAVPATVVRVGEGDSKIVRGGYSVDDGLHWMPFGGEPASSMRGGGRVAISADGKTVVWSVDRGVPSWSDDWGKSWTACVGLGEAMQVVADRVNPSRFYSFNMETGQLLVSVDGARTFTARTEPVAVKDHSVELAATPGLEGDLWIGTGGKVFHTLDAGVTFVTLEGMTKVYRIGFGMPASGQTMPSIFLNGLAASVEGLYRSDDAGKSWVRVDDAQHQFGWKNAVIGDPRVFGRVYLATGGRGIVYGEPLAQANSAAVR
jgi:hypothetical protein